MKQSDRTEIRPFEIDILVKDLKIGFEFNGMFWHSVENGTDIHQHLNKTKLCEEKGIKLVHIFENQWKYEKEKTKQLIRNMILNQNFIYEANDISNDIMYVRRHMFNKCFSFDGYELIGETPPELMILRNGKQTHSVPDCGNLIYKKIRSEE